MSVWFWIFVAALIVGFIWFLRYQKRNKYPIVEPKKRWSPREYVPNEYLEQDLCVDITNHRARIWASPPTFEQDPNSMFCVAITGWQWLKTAPVNKQPSFTMEQLFAEAQKRDDHPDGLERGTKMQGVLKFFKEQNLVSDWFDLMTVTDLADYVYNVGPAAASIKFPALILPHSGTGFVNVDGTMGINHCILIHGVDYDMICPGEINLEALAKESDAPMVWYDLTKNQLRAESGVTPSKVDYGGGKGAFRVQIWYGGSNIGCGGRCWISFNAMQKVLPREQDGNKRQMWHGAIFK